MYFTATADNGQRKVKENLDDFNELQEFMNKVEQRGFLNVDVIAYDNTGCIKTINYKFDGQQWQK